MHRQAHENKPVEIFCIFLPVYEIEAFQFNSVPHFVFAADSRDAWNQCCGDGARAGAARSRNFWPEPELEPVY